MKDGILFKVGKIENLNKLQKGSVYMNRLDYFTKKENQINGDGFLDKEEGKVFKGDVTLQTPTKKIVLENCSCKMGMGIPIFCCSRLRISDETDMRKEINIDPQFINDFTNGNANEYGVLFMNKREFLQRVKYAAEQKNLIYYLGTVQYKEFVNSRQNIDDFPKAIFRKSPRFTYQNEYRIALQTDVSDHFELEIDDISAISLLGNMNMLKRPINAEEIKKKCNV